MSTRQSLLRAQTDKHINTCHHIKTASAVVPTTVGGSNHKLKTKPVQYCNDITVLYVQWHTNLSCEQIMTPARNFGWLEPIF